LGVATPNLGGPPDARSLLRAYPLGDMQCRQSMRRTEMFKSIKRLLVAATAILVLSAPSAAFATRLLRMAVVRRAARGRLR
jgi:hypothetical protein